MNSEVKAKWLEALRSGEYKQARYMLKSCNDAFCCLGVLCDIYIDEVEGCWVSDEGDHTEGYSMINFNKLERAKTDLPPSVIEWANLEEANPQVFVGHCTSCDARFNTLTELNDSGKDFEFIADLIDHHL